MLHWDDKKFRKIDGENYVFLNFLSCNAASNKSVQRLFHGMENICIRDDISLCVFSPGSNVDNSIPLNPFLESLNSFGMKFSPETMTKSS